jgi:hypothetical protein
MSQSSPKFDSDEKKAPRLVDHRGKPLPQPVTWREQWHVISARTRIIVGSLLVIVAATAAFLVNLEKIQDHFRSEPAAPSVPAIMVKLSNSATEEIYVVTRGDFFLWLPGSGARHAIGKYEFRTMDGNVSNAGQIAVKPNTTLTVYAQVLNQELYGNILEQAECDISFHVRRVKGGLTFTQNLPFTKEAIEKYYVTVDVGAD